MLMSQRTGGCDRHASADHSSANHIQVDNRTIPSVLLTNANHLMNKLDELYILLSHSIIDIVCLTETWLTTDIPNCLCNLPNFTLFRRDRTERLGGGVCCYVRTNNNPRLLEPPVVNLHSFEVLWVALRPKVLPRPISIVIVLVVYVPPWYDVATKRSLADYIVSCVDYFNSLYFNVFYHMTGDFNSLETSFFNRQLRFKQILTGRTRGNNTLDKIFTNFSELYRDSEILPPLGRSDHNCVVLRASVLPRLPVGYTDVRRRVFSGRVYDSIGRELVNVNWAEIYKIDNVQDQADVFYNILSSAVDKYAPVQQHVLKNNDKPWITPGFKELVAQRNNSFQCGNLAAYKILRNRVNRLRKGLQQNYFNNKIRNLKNVNNKRWWKEIKSISGLDRSDASLTIFDNVCYQGSEVQSSSLPDVINSFLVSVADSVPVIRHDLLSNVRSELTVCPTELIVSEFEVYMTLVKLKVNKASLNDYISNKLLKELADVLAAPICALVNTSIRQGVVPTQWKMSRISPIPKCLPVRNIESDIRPIAVTCPISNVAEFFYLKAF